MNVFIKRDDLRFLLNEEYDRLDGFMVWSIGDWENHDDGNMSYADIILEKNDHFYRYNESRAVIDMEEYYEYGINSESVPELIELTEVRSVEVVKIEWEDVD